MKSGVFFSNWSFLTNASLFGARTCSKIVNSLSVTNKCSGKELTVAPLEGSDAKISGYFCCK